MPGPRTERIAIKRGSAFIAQFSGLVETYISARHMARAEKSKYPLDGPGSVTDHIVNLPDQLRIKGWSTVLAYSISTITNVTPETDQSGNAPEVLAEDVRGRPRWDKLQPARAFAAMRGAMRDAILLEVYTPWHKYTDMVITEFKAEQNPSTWVNLPFEFTLEQVQYGTALRTPARIDASSPGADTQPSTSSGEVSSSEVTTITTPDGTSISAARNEDGTISVSVNGEVSTDGNEAIARFEEEAKEWDDRAKGGPQGRPITLGDHLAIGLDNLFGINEISEPGADRKAQEARNNAALIRHIWWWKDLEAGIGQ